MNLQPMNLHQAVAKLWLALPTITNPKTEDAARAAVVALGVDPDAKRLGDTMKAIADGDLERPDAAPFYVFRAPPGMTGADLDDIARAVNALRAPAAVVPNGFAVDPIDLPHLILLREFIDGVIAAERPADPEAEPRSVTEDGETLADGLVRAADLADHYRRERDKLKAELDLLRQAETLDDSTARAVVEDIRRERDELAAKLEHTRKLALWVVACDVEETEAAVDSLSTLFTNDEIEAESARPRARIEMLTAEVARLERDLSAAGDRRDWDGCNRIEAELETARELLKITEGDPLPVFPDIGCTHDPGECGFIVAGLGYQCLEGSACRRYIHPGDPHFDELRDYDRKMTALSKRR